MAMIECKAKKDKSIFVSAHGYITPCCFIYGYNVESAKELDNLIKRYNNKSHSTHKIQKILDESKIQEICNVCFYACDDSMKSHHLSNDSWEKQFRNPSNDS